MQGDLEKEELRLCSSLVIAFSSFQPLYLSSWQEPPSMGTPFLLLFSIRTMEKRLTLTVTASLTGEQGGPGVLKSTHGEANDTQCYLGFFLLCIRHTRQGCRDKMVMIEWRFPVHPCLGMCVGAEGQDSIAKGLRVGRRDFGGSFP